MLLSKLATTGLLCATVTAQSFSYPDFAATPQLNLLGSTAQNANAIQLTDSVSNQAGWLWRDTAMPILAGFDTTFTFRIEPPAAGIKGEGFAFVIHDDANQASATGGTSWGMGYGEGANLADGIRDSIAIEFDTYQDVFLGDTSNNEVTVHTRGSEGNREHEQWSIGSAIPPANFSDGQTHVARIVYTPGLLEVYVDNMTTPAISTSYDLETGGTYLDGTGAPGIDTPSGFGFVGFCATTGSGAITETVTIESWTWTSTAPTDPCYLGTLGADTLTINGSNGGFFRTVQINTFEPFSIEVNDPPGYGPGAPYVLVGSLLPQPGAIGTNLGFGSACFPMMPLGAAELVLANTLSVGSGLLPAQPTPHTMQIPPGIVTFPLEMTLQALTLDSAQPLTLGLTNAVDLSVVLGASPTIASISPASPPAGSTVTVTGQNFANGLSLMVGTTATPPLSVTSDTITFAWPAGPNCDATVSVTNPDGQSTSTSTNPSPTITNTISAFGSFLGGQSFILQGQNFQPGSTVTIGGNAATVVNITAFTVLVTTPPGNVGASPVVLTSPGGCTATTTYFYQ